MLLMNGAQGLTAEVVPGDLIVLACALAALAATEAIASERACVHMRVVVRLQKAFSQGQGWGHVRWKA